MANDNTAGDTDRIWNLTGSAAISNDHAKIKQQFSPPANA